LNINIVCLPNGQLAEHYGARVLSAGKINSEARFNFIKVKDFELLENKKRIRIIYFDKNMKDEYRKRLKDIEEIYDKH